MTDSFNNWVGGLYYVKNIIFSLTQNENFIHQKIYILVNKKNREVFSEFLKYSNCCIIETGKNKISTSISIMSSKLLFRTIDLEVIRICKKYNINYIFPVNKYPYILNKNKCIFWIPDLQHIFLPELFNKHEIIHRNMLFRYISKAKNNLVLSSKSAFNDFKSSFPTHRCKVRVIPFVSYIENEVMTITDQITDNVKQKYKLPQKFIFLPNQFWQHKNHELAFKAIDYLVNHLHNNVCLVCTGNTNDYRNVNYYNSLISYISDNNITDNIRILGFIPRIDQLAIMKLSTIVIQPSLFEGWGTVVEDCKVLDKYIIMSDLDVHYEQASSKSYIFKRDDHVDLAVKIQELLALSDKESQISNVDKGISYIYNQAKEYAYQFYNILDEK